MFEELPCWICFSVGGTCHTQCTCFSSTYIHPLFLMISEPWKGVSIASLCGHNQSLVLHSIINGYELKDTRKVGDCDDKHIHLESILTGTSHPSRKTLEVVFPLGPMSFPETDFCLAHSTQCELPLTERASNPYRRLLVLPTIIESLLCKQAQPARHVGVLAYWVYSQAGTLVAVVHQ